MKPLVSVIVVNWNGIKWLNECFRSILKQSYANIEVICVDNASTDGSREFMQKNFPTIHFIETGSNLGFAGGNNVGLEHARGDMIFLLNNDTKSPPDLVEKLVAGFEEFPNAGILQPKIRLLRDPDYLDACGAFWTSSTFLYHFGIRKKAKMAIYNRPQQFFSIKGAAMMIRRDVITKVGFFDADFWCYYEETDLCHRAWLAGFESWYYPGAEVEHAMGGTALTFKNDFIQFHNFKNKLLSFLKNFSAPNLLRFVPVFIFLNILLSIYWLTKGKWRHALALYKAIWWNARNLGHTLKKRRAIQATRTSADREILAKTQRNPRLEYYRELVGGRLAEYVD